MKTRFLIVTLAIAISIMMVFFVAIPAIGVAWWSSYNPRDDQTYSDSILSGTRNSIYESVASCKGNEMCLAEEIVRIIDGDTIVLLNDHTIRLSLTNTPELYQAGYNEATRFTAETCPVGTIAIVDQDDLQPYDVYGRMLGKVTCGEKILNNELLYSGHANILTRYCTTSEFSDETWAQEFGC